LPGATCSLRRPLAELALRTRLFTHALHLDAAAVRDTPTGEVMSLAQNDIEAVRQAQTMGLVAGIDASLYAVVAAAAMLWLAPAVSLPCSCRCRFWRPAWACAARDLRALDRVQQSLDLLTERSRESLAGVRVLRAFGREQADAARHGVIGQRWLAASLAYARIDALFYPLVLLGAGLCTAILLARGGPAVVDGQLTLGTFVALSTYLGMLVWPMIAAGWMVAMVATGHGLPGSDRALPGPPGGRGCGGAGRPPLAARPRPTRAARAELHLPGAATPALHQVSVTVPAGTSLGVVGAIGSGKSTLAALVLRLQEPPPGSVLVDGQDVTTVTAASLRAAIAWVPQEAFLFSDTIAANLRLGLPAAAGTSALDPTDAGRARTRLPAGRGARRDRGPARGLPEPAGGAGHHLEAAANGSACAGARALAAGPDHRARRHALGRRRGHREHHPGRRASRPWPAAPPWWSRTGSARCARSIRSSSWPAAGGAARQPRRARGQRGVLPRAGPPAGHDEPATQWVDLMAADQTSANPRRGEEQLGTYSAVALFRRLLPFLVGRRLALALLSLLSITMAGIELWLP